ncbi:MAG: biotin--[acetyl-CoA-carboxylase] ligase [Elusimicrobiota bacterium]|jgi:BirA family biotin operon repressor/biotin-[acetyl-CoA-carboxylase] ligase
MHLPGISQVLRLEETDSTQTVARFLAEQGAPDRTLVWAELQTAGRGRLRRCWQSRRGGLYFSLILRPDFAPTRLTELNLLAAQTVAETLAGAGVATEVKPPNDVMAAQGRKRGKICGILAEAAGNDRRVEWLILGVGINLNNPVQGVKGAVSLQGLTGRCWEPADVLKHFLERFRPAYARLNPA